MHTCVKHGTATPDERLVTPPAGLFAAMLTLGLGGFFIGTGEFASMSLLPSLADGTGVSVPEAGRYISAYAIGVVKQSEYNALEETAYLLRSPANAKRLINSIESLKAGNGTEKDIIE